MKDEGDFADGQTDNIIVCIWVIKMGFHHLLHVSVPLTIFVNNIDS